jgi:hypothetical protein
VEKVAAGSFIRNRGTNLAEKRTLLFPILEITLCRPRDIQGYRVNIKPLIGHRELREGLVNSKKKFRAALAAILEWIKKARGKRGTEILIKLRQKLQAG